MIAADEYQALLESAGFLERTDRGRLRVSGADRLAYLQGLVTNDVGALQPGGGCYAAMLTPQGRMITDMRVLELGNAVQIDLPAGLATPIRDRLEQFVFSEDVTAADVSASLAQVGVYGPQAADAAGAAIAALGAAAAPDAERLRRLELFAHVRAGVDGGAVVAARSDDFGVHGYELFFDAALLDRMQAALRAGGAGQVSMATADVTRIEAGRPAFGKDMFEDTIPLEAGIEERAISQTKGCYVGQEIIIRVLHRGHGRVARRLVGLVLDGVVPASGARLRSGERDVGSITSATHSPALGRAVALGYVHRDFVEPGTQLTVEGGGGFLPATVAALPLVRRQVEPVRS